MRYIFIFKNINRLKITNLRENNRYIENSALDINFEWVLG